MRRDGEAPRPLDYATPPPDGVPWWAHVWKYVLWPLILINGYGFGILGVIFSLTGLINLFRHVEGLYLFGRPVETVLQKVAWLALSVSFAAAGVSFAVWHSRRFLRASPRRRVRTHGS